MPAWTKEQLEILRLRYPVERTTAIAEAVGRNPQTVMHKARLLGISKDPAFMSLQKSENAKANPNSGQWNRKHGYAVGNNPTYNSWWSMRQRCEDIKHKSYKDYGGRGITVYEEWKTFTNFLRDVGERPSLRHTLGRIYNNGCYVPGNVRWETAKEQYVNRQSNRFLTAFGKTLTVAQWAEESGIPRSSIEKRLDQMGWPLERALSVPVRSYSRRKSEAQ